MRCPICKTASAPRRQNAQYPFCSPRCKLIDLGRWLREDYVISEPLVQSEAEETADLERTHGTAPGGEADDDNPTLH